MDILDFGCAASMTQPHRKLLEAAVAVAQAKRAMDRTYPVSEERKAAVDELHKKLWAMRSAAVAFSKTSLGRNISRELEKAAR